MNQLLKYACKPKFSFTNDGGLLYTNDAHKELKEGLMRATKHSCSITSPKPSVQDLYHITIACNHTALPVDFW